MKFSIVIPLYNKAHYISRAINSVLSQTIQDFEIIVIDDGSTDDGAAIVRNFSDERIHLIQQKNEGISSARNLGIQTAKAELIAFLDADDEWCPCFLEKIDYLVRKYPECIMFATAYSSQNAVEKEIRNPTCSDSENDYVIHNLFTTYLASYPFTTSSVCVRKQPTLKMGGFPKITIAEDIFAWLKLSTIGCIAYSKSVLSIYYRGTDTSVLQNRSQQQELDAVEFLNNWLEEGTIPEHLKPGARELLLKKSIDYAQACLERGDPDSAEKYIKLGIGTKKNKLKRFVIAAAIKMPRLYKKLISIKRQLLNT